MIALRTAYLRRQVLPWNGFVIAARYRLGYRLLPCEHGT